MLESQSKFQKTQVIT